MTKLNILTPTKSELDAITATWAKSKKKKGNLNHAFRSILIAKGIKVETDGAKLQTQDELIGLIPKTELKNVKMLFETATLKESFSKLDKAIDALEPKKETPEPKKEVKAPKASEPKKEKMPLFVEDSHDFTKGLGEQPKKQPKQAKLTEQIEPTQTEINQKLFQTLVNIDSRLTKAGF